MNGWTLDDLAALDTDVYDVLVQLITEEQARLTPDD